MVGATAAEGVDEAGATDGVVESGAAMAPAIAVSEGRRANGGTAFLLPERGMARAAVRAAEVATADAAAGAEEPVDSDDENDTGASAAAVSAEAASGAEKDDGAALPAAASNAEVGGGREAAAVTAPLFGGCDAPTNALVSAGGGDCFAVATKGTVTVAVLST